MEQMIFKKLKSLDEDFYIEVKRECLALAEKLNWNDGLNQIMLQSNQPDVDDYKTGLGRIANNLDAVEENYIHVLPSLRGTSLEKLIVSLNGFRSRLMYMKPKSCYSIHTDPSPRLHLALQTNDQALFLFPKHRGYFKIPEDRSIYLADTRFSHSFMNGSDEPRIHLVICTKLTARDL